MSDMQQGFCPKCGSGDVRILRTRFTQRNQLPVNWWGRAVQVDNFICAGCGYVEDYVRETDLARVAQKLPQVRDTEPI